MAKNGDKWSDHLYFLPRVDKNDKCHKIKRQQLIEKVFIICFKAMILLTMVEEE